MITKDTYEGRSTHRATRRMMEKQDTHTGVDALLVGG